MAEEDDGDTRVPTVKSEGTPGIKVVGSSWVKENYSDRGALVQNLLCRCEHLIAMSVHWTYVVDDVGAVLGLSLIGTVSSI